MRQLAAFLTCVLAVTTVAQGQCCLGAQNVQGDSPEGRWRVTGTSLTGTGVGVHGPYHYRFRFLERKEGGKHVERSHFELRWDTKAHFGMRLYVSPTGNGVAVNFPNQRLAFYTRAGKKTFDSGPRIPIRLAAAGHNVVLCRVLPLRDRDGGMYLEDSRVFLPLGAKVTKQLSNQVMWWLLIDDKRIQRALPKVEIQVRELGSADPAASKSAREALLFYGYLSIQPLERELSRVKDEAHRARIQELLSALSPWQEFASPDAWHDLPFLLSLIHYPDEMIKNRARRAVVLLLAPELRKRKSTLVFQDKALFEETLDWVREHQTQLFWDPAKGHYAMTGKHK